MPVLDVPGLRKLTVPALGAACHLYAGDKLLPCEVVVIVCLNLPYHELEPVHLNLLLLYYPALRLPVVTLQALSGTFEGE